MLIPISGFLFGQIMYFIGSYTTWNSMSYTSVSQQEFPYRYGSFTYGGQSLLRKDQFLLRRAKSRPSISSKPDPEQEHFRAGSLGQAFRAGSTG